MIAKANNILRQLANNKLALIFTLLVLSEFVYKICIKEYFHAFKISAALKTVLQLFFVIQILRNDYKKLWPVLALTIVFLLGQVGFVPWEQLQKNAWFLDKYLFIILALVYVQTIKDVSKYYPLFFRVFEVFIIINSICVLLGLLLPTDWFNTYYGAAKRFGLNGTILRSGASTYIYWIALFYYASECIVQKKKKYIPFALVFVASLLLGTKAMFIGYIFLVIFVFISLGGHKNKWLLIAAGLLITAGFIVFDDVLHWLITRSPSLQEVYDERGIWSVVFSLRDQHLLEEMLPLIQEKWTWRNYLFGGGYDMHFRSQFGLLDLFYFFGIIGTVAYLYIFNKLFCTFKWNFPTILFAIGTFVLMAFSANFFYETILAFHLVFVKCYFEKINSL
jgi:hypothetical protein